MIKYKVNIIDKLKEKGISSYKIRQENLLGQAILTRFRNGEYANIDLNTLGKICDLLECQPNDIIENV